ncbi:MAG: Nif3-like dinuclear metal center hexameric protein [Finegoldia sp.]|nr:Nif3-like dinuclear metal center hexameric protein [Finegoldia sp.]
MKLRDLINYYEEVVPLNLQEAYDNCGLQFGDLEGDIKKIIIALDLDKDTLNKAIEENYDLIITHHPVIFKPLKNISYDNSIKDRLIKAVKNDISIYSSHTNLDKIKGGVSYGLGERLGLRNLKTLDPEDDYGNGIGCYGYVDRIVAKSFIGQVKSNLNLDNVIAYGNLDRKIEKIALVGGSGGSLIQECINQNCDVLISSEFDHDKQILAVDNDLILLDISHYDSEKFGLYKIKNILEEKFTDLDLKVNLINNNIRRTF